MKWFSLLATLGSLATPGLALADNFAGYWISEGDGMVLNLTDDGTTVSGSCSTAGFDHTVTGTHSTQTKVSLTIERKSLTDGCVTKMFGTWERVDDNTAKWQIVGTAGRCGLSTSYQEKRTFHRS